MANKCCYGIARLVSCAYYVELNKQHFTNSGQDSTRSHYSDFSLKLFIGFFCQPLSMLHSILSIRYQVQVFIEFSCQCLCTVLCQSTMFLLNSHFITILISKYLPRRNGNSAVPLVSVCVPYTTPRILLYWQLIILIYSKCRQSNRTALRLSVQMTKLWFSLTLDFFHIQDLLY